MNTYRVIFSPELEIDPATFATFWNSQPHLQDKGRIEVQSPQAGVSYDLPVWAVAALVFMGTMAADIAKTVIVDVAKEYIQQHVKNTESPQFEIIEKKTEDGKILLIVLPKKEN